VESISTDGGIDWDKRWNPLVAKVEAIGNRWKELGSDGGKYWY